MTLLAGIAITAAAKAAAPIVAKVAFSAAKTVANAAVKTAQAVVGAVATAGKIAAQAVKEAAIFIKDTAVKIAVNAKNCLIALAKAIGQGMIVLGKMVIGAVSGTIFVGTVLISHTPVVKLMNKIESLVNPPAPNKLQTDPTPLEAANMAEKVYDKNLKIGEKVDGWECVHIEDPKYMSLKIAVFAKEVNGEMAYTVVNKGTTPTNIMDWVNNAAQPFGASPDMNKSIKFANDFAKDNPNANITFVGHSKGGAEAAAMAVATNSDCIIFNPATANLTANGLSSKGYDANMSTYVVKGEVLNSIFGGASKPIGGIEYLEPTPQYAGIHPIDKHGMEAVIDSLKAKEAGK